MTSDTFVSRPQHGFVERWGQSVRYRIGDWIRIGVLLLFSVIVLAPLVWMFSTSLRLPVESFSLPPKWIPTDFHWQNYRDVITLKSGGAYGTVSTEAGISPFMGYVLNSATVTIAIVLGQLVTATLAGYAFAHLAFRGKSVLFWIVMATMMIPLQATIIPVFVMISRLHLSNTLAALIFPAWPTAFGTFLLRQYFLTIPKEFDEAAAIDGANPWQVFARVYLPLVTPGQAILAVLAFNTFWNEFYRPLIFLHDRPKFTLPLGLVAMQTEFGTTSIAIVLAGVVLSMVPVVIVYIFGQRYLVEGIMMGGVKS